MTREELVALVEKAVRGAADYQQAAEQAVTALETKGLLTPVGRPPAPSRMLFLEPPAAGGGPR